MDLFWNGSVCCAPEVARQVDGGSVGEPENNWGRLLVGHRVGHHRPMMARRSHIWYCSRKVLV